MWRYAYLIFPPNFYISWPERKENGPSSPTQIKPRQNCDEFNLHSPLWTNCYVQRTRITGAVWATRSFLWLGWGQRSYQRNRRNSVQRHYFQEITVWLFWFSGQVMSNSCDPMDRNLPGSPVHGNLQARILDWVASISFSRGSFPSRDQTHVSCIADQFFTNWACRETQNIPTFELRVF